MPTIDDILTLFYERGDSQYGGENVTQLEHALQCASLAEREGASPSLITAALLHDVGHLLHSLPVDAPDQGVDDTHEELGHRYLSRIFDESVTEPVRLHVPAKRYLCATDSDYAGKLSGPSLVSLGLQGGKMSEAEVAAFRANAFADDAVRLRRWDDLAKIVDLKTRPIDHFVQFMQASAAAHDPEC